MRLKSIIIGSILILILLSMSGAAFAQPGEYLLGPEDELIVTVWGYDDLKTEVTVRPDGMISVPLVGDVKAEGMTVNQLTKNLDRKLAYFLRNPHANVVVKTFKGKKVFVLGEVTKPGMYKLNEDDNLAEAVTTAGWLTSKGYWTKVGIIRNTEKGQQIIYSDLGSFLKKGDATQNTKLEAGDVVFIPKKDHWDLTAVAQAFSIANFFR